MRILLPLPVIALVVGLGAVQSRPDARPWPPAASPGDPDSAAATITAEEMRQRIAHLASDELGGRGTPSPGLEAAAAYIAAEFRGRGLMPAGDDGTFLQRFPLQVRALDTAATHLALVHGGRTEMLAHGADFTAIEGAPARFSAALVYAGEEVGDADSGALRDRVVALHLAGMPTTPDFFRRLQGLRAAAERAGAAAVVFVLDADVPEREIRSLAELSGRPRGLVLGELRDRPVFLVREPALRRVLDRAGVGMDDLAPRAADRPAPVDGLVIEGAAPAKILEDHRVPNVVAVLPGSDPALRDSYVVVSAHMDHLGTRQPGADGDSIFNGADDNASGTAALLEVAEAFAALPVAPPRSIVFLAVSGEERGLLGSRYFSENPTVPLEGIVANVNADMIGRNAPDSIVAIGQEYSSLGPLVQKIARSRPGLGLTVAPDLWPQERLFFRSDHFHFARRGIPAIFFFAGLHEDYHQASDEVEKIDADKAARVARLIFHTANAIASGAEPPQWTEEGLRAVRAMTGGGR